MLTLIPATAVLTLAIGALFGFWARMPIVFEGMAPPAAGDMSDFIADGAAGKRQNVNVEAIMLTFWPLRVIAVALFPVRSEGARLAVPALPVLLISNGFFAPAIPESPFAGASIRTAVLSRMRQRRGADLNFELVDGRACRPAP